MFPLFLFENKSEIQFSFSFFSSSTGLRYFAGAATIAVIVLGVLGNLLTMAALIKCPKIRNLNAAFITRSLRICQSSECSRSIRLV